MSGQFGLSPTSYGGCSCPPAVSTPREPVTGSGNVFRQPMARTECMPSDMIPGAGSSGMQGMKDFALFIQQIVVDAIVQVVGALFSAFGADPSTLFGGALNNTANTQAQPTVVTGNRQTEQSERSDTGLFQQLGADIDVVVNGAGKVKDSFGEVLEGAGNLLKRGARVFTSFLGFP